jgi:mRNA-degrading endonuclease RelE of RelBE toxin-antitoxin system
MSTAAPWTINLAGKVVKQLDRLPSHDSAAIRGALRELAIDPLRYPNPNVKRLRGHEYGWRLRVGSYRAFYDLDPLTRSIAVGSVERRTSKTYPKRRR